MNNTQTFLDTVHTAYVFFCKENQLHQMQFWLNVMNILEPITKQSQFSSTVLPGIYDEQTSEWVEYDDLKWTKADLAKWVDAENDKPKNLRIDRVSIFFPTMDHCYKKKVTPDIFIKASVKATDKEKRYESVFALIVKNDFMDHLSGVDTEKILKQLQAHLQAEFVASIKRPWAIKSANFQYSDAFQYFFPSEILANRKKFIFRAGYAAWRSWP